MFKFSTFAFALSCVGLIRAAVIDGLATRTSSSSDTCACTTGPLNIAGVSCGTFHQSDNFCFCMSELDSLIQNSNNPIIQFARFFDVDLIKGALTQMVHNAESRSDCDRPDFSAPSCSRDNVCGYKCHDGYKDCGDSCARACSTARLGRKRRSVPTEAKPDYWGARVQRTCEQGWQACGVPGADRRAWECVDVQRDLESCGGCASGISSSLTGQSTGVDCTTIPHVSDVSCISGGCVVHRCLPGYITSPSGDACLSKDFVDRTPLSIVGEKIFDIAAAALSL
ncbi:unnamed protein product [Mycena citricolor]|uniref:Protein CPL1-like domain-containing protein n=1 Tax=Mycena citricolor TaxID=2018698 RepID=A0AAD2JZS2_9AGAR|nr:unnamed protein product [Mycena citricolor]